MVFFKVVNITASPPPMLIDSLYLVATRLPSRCWNLWLCLNVSCSPGVPRQLVGPIPLGIVPRAFSILNKSLLLLLPTACGSALIRNHLVFPRFQTNSVPPTFPFCPILEPRLCWHACGAVPRSFKNTPMAPQSQDDARFSTFYLSPTYSRPIRYKQSAATFPIHKLPIYPN